jgi:tryptophanyl-tRNA synthetase
MWEYFEPMRKRREELENNLDYVWDILRKGGERAREEAEKTMVKVREAVGLR